MCTASTAMSTTRRKMMKGKRRFKAPNCRGGCISRKFRGAHCLPAVVGGGGFNARTQNDEMLTSRRNTLSS
jgi:hypothetical protein